MSVRRHVLAAVVAVGCAGPRPVAPAPAPTPASATKPPPVLSGHLLVHSFGKDALFECKPACAPLDDPRLGKVEQSPRRVAPGRYLLQAGVFDLATRALVPLAPKLDLEQHRYGNLWVLDAAIVSVEFKSTHDVVLVSRAGKPFVPLAEPIPPKAGDFAFLPDGRHLFKTAPLMGAAESAYFTDVIVGQKVTLHYVGALGGKPTPLVARDQTLHPDFVRDGASIVYWAPGRLDVQTAFRSLYLERVDVADGAVTRLEELVTPITMRGTPETLHHGRSRFVVHTTHGANGKESGVRVVDVEAKAVVDVPLAADESLARPFNPTHAGNWPWCERRDDDVLILRRPVDGGVHVRVLSLPGLDTVLEATVPTPHVTAIDWIRH